MGHQRCGRRGVRLPGAVVVAGLLVASVPAVPAGAGAAGLQSPWNLDRVNQTRLPLDGNVSMGGLTGEGVDVYVVDTGVRPTHEQIAGRVRPGVDAFSGDEAARVDPASSDCDGHGTHVATTIAGSSVGVAAKATIISVRVLDCAGDGEVEGVVSALQWVRHDHESGRLAIVNLSLGVDLGDNGQGIIDEVVALARDGVISVVAAGNGDGAARGIDACRIAPGSEPVALTVGATTATDAAATYSNHGPCVDIFAPGGDSSQPVRAGWYRSDNDYDTDIGTSMAAPLVSGYLALLAGRQPGLCVAQAAGAVVARATKDAITGLAAGTANRLLFIDPAPVTELVAPGRPSNVLVTADVSSLLVGWDNPCDGGSAVTSTKVSVLYRGRVVKSAVVDAATRAVRVRGLVRGRTYHVVVKATNAVGAGTATARVKAPRVAGLRVGRSVALEDLASTDTGSEIVARSLSPKVCAVRGADVIRLAGVARGRCRYAVRHAAGTREIVRTIVVER